MENRKPPSDHLGQISGTLAPLNFISYISGEELPILDQDIIKNWKNFLKLNVKGIVGYKSSPENPQYLLIYASPEFLVFDNRVISGDQRYTDR